MVRMLEILGAIGAVLVAVTYGATRLISARHAIRSRCWCEQNGLPDTTQAACRRDGVCPKAVSTDAGLAHKE